MSKIIYVCDGSKRSGMFGAGIVRYMPERSLNYFSFDRKINYKGSSEHEEFSLIKTLEKILEYGDCNAVIYNDSMTLVDSLNNKSQYESILFNEARKHLIKLKRMGYKIKIRHTNELDKKELLSIAHKSSRSYLGEEIKVFYRPKITYSVDSKQLSENKNIQNEPDDKWLVDSNKILTNKLFIFQKVSLKKWGLFDENYNLLLKHRDITGISKKAFLFFIDNDLNNIKVNHTYINSIKALEGAKRTRGEYLEIKKLMDKLDFEVISLVREYDEKISLL